MAEIMRREMESQPVILADAIAPLAAAARHIPLPGTVERVIFCGCGDSLFAGMALAPRGSEPVRFEAASALELCAYRDVGRADLVVGISISGTTPRTVEAVRRARASGASTVAITVDRASPLADAASQVLALPYQPISRETPHTLDYVMSAAALLTLVERWTGQSTGLDRLPDLARATLGSAAGSAERFARGWRPDGQLFVLGAGPGLGTAHYVAAKFQEAFGTRAIAAELENVAHGQHLMLRQGDAVVLLALDAASQAQVTTMLPAIVGLGMRVVVIGADDVMSEAEHVRVAEPAGPLAQLAAAVVGQVLCLAVAEAYGLPVVWPRDHPLLAAQRAWR